MRKKKRFLGFVLLGCGAWLLYMGFNAFDRGEGTWTSQMLAGNLPDQALLFWIGGVVLCIVGVLHAKRD